MHHIKKVQTNILWIVKNILQKIYRDFNPISKNELLQTQEAINSMPREILDLNSSNRVFEILKNFF